MKWLLVIVAMPAIGWAQFGNVDESIRQLVTSAMVTSPEMKALSRTGDPAAAALNRYIAGMSLDAPAMERLLMMVHGSFESPALVERVTDREPVATLSLLAYLDGQTHDDAVRKKIVDERVFVLGQVAKLKAGATCLLANHTAMDVRPATVDTVQMSKVYRLLSEWERSNFDASRRMGDRAAGYLTRLIGSCMLDSDDIGRVLRVVHWSFEHGRLTADQTLTLLQTLQMAGNAAEIDATRQYVLAQIH